MSIESYNYDNPTTIGVGNFVTRSVPLAADTYYKGMLLEFDGTAVAYKALASGTIAGVYTGADARVLATAGYGDIIVGGEILHSNLVSNANAALTLTETQIALYAQSGFYVRER